MLLTMAPSCTGTEPLALPVVRFASVKTSSSSPPVRPNFFMAARVSRGQSPGGGRTWAPAHAARPLAQTAAAARLLRREAVGFLGGAEAGAAGVGAFTAEASFSTGVSVPVGASVAGRAWADGGVRANSWRTG